MIKNKVNRLITMLFCFIIILSAIYLPVGNVYAEGTNYPFDTTDPLDDLETSENFNLSDYLWDTSGNSSKPSIVNFVEWCYSPFKTGDYALYIYFYNPERLQITTNSISNRIQIASAYTDENGAPTAVITQNSIPSDYDTYQLIYCGMSMRTNYEGMFYKFRVVDKKTADGKTIEQRVNSTERRYDVSGIALADKQGKVKEYTVGGTYRFTGYAAGYGPNVDSPSTLQNNGYTALETLRLEVHPTNYRVDGISDLGAGHQWDLTSVYFSVPEVYFTKYGNLQKVKAEWWEYKTQPIIIVTDNNQYNDLKPYIGIDLLTSPTRPNYYLYAQRVAHLTDYRWDTDNYVGYTYNILPKEGYDNGEPIYRSTYLFQSENKYISKNQIETYTKNYTASFVKGKLDIKNGQISADLFQDNVDDGRTRGYNCQEIDANDKVNLLSWDDAGVSVWEKFWNYGFDFGITGTSFNNISPINSNISAAEIALNDNSLANTLLIDENDAGAFKTFYNNAKDNNERTVIFHFAKTDYYAKSAIAINGADPPFYWIEENASFSTETVFLDFKIIHLTFKDPNNRYKVIPVVSDPVDIYKDVTPALTPKYELPDWLKGLKGLGDKVAAWIILIVAIIIGALLFWLMGVILRSINNIGNVIVKLLLMLAVLAIFGVIGYFGGTWVYGVINGLGGLL